MQEGSETHTFAWTPFVRVRGSADEAAVFRVNVAVDEALKVNVTCAGLLKG